jgi:hypothetical protein
MFNSFKASFNVGASLRFAISSKLAFNSGVSNKPVFVNLNALPFSLLLYPS